MHNVTISSSYNSLNRDFMRYTTMFTPVYFCIYLFLFYSVFLLKSWPF
ncbi:hypothetical protein PORCRE_916 [Porphyromonas crevioricanis JCM 15906]|uniref:Uncharacterized protein n=1 Tax=Porphyromonas crevioricanis JCM 15906 TaxID=1305617 RepID=T1CH88_9PORP|nr:hypothetical protein PORCRE_916 [Porphyromonas crevioricanis JCM 15906]GAD06451.1 hypothetical protein PORCAN_47 [Porphyromonas crevioricanis JCM 13913]